MNRRIKSALLGVIALCASQASFAVLGTAVGNVNYVYVYGDGRVLVNGFTFSGATCTQNGSFWIDGDHPHIARILALVLSAKASGTQLTVSAKIDNCWYPQITADSTTFVVMDP